MSGWWAVVRREVGERRSVLAVALLLGASCLLAPALVGGPEREARGLAIAVALLVFVPAVAVLAGASALVPDLVSRRLGFYFSRPLGGLAIALGKLAGALGLALAAAALVAAPALVAGADLDRVVHPRFEEPAWRLAIALALPVVVLLAHTVAVWLRSGSRWLAADAACAALAVGLTARAAQGLLDLHAVEPATVVAAGSTLAAAASLALACLASALAGRTDPVRVHRLLSTWLWSGTLAAALAFTGYAERVIAARPRDLEWIHGARAGPGNRWLHVAGVARGSMGEYLLDTVSGRHLRLRPLVAMSFSADGRRVALLEAGGHEWPWPVELTFVRLDADRLEVVPTGGAPLPLPAGLVLSADGRRVATFAAGNLAVLELDPPRSLASARVFEVPAEAIDPGWRLRWPEPGRVRLYLPGERGVEIRELDVATRRLETTGVAGSVRGDYLVSATDDRLLFFARDETPGSVVTLHDGRTGALLATLAQGEALITHSQNSGFLADGRIAIGERRDGVPWLLVFSSDGAAECAVALSGALDEHLRIGSEVEPGRLAVALGGWHSPVSRLFLVDLASGGVEELGSGLWPEHGLSEDDAVAPGSLASRLFLETGPGREERRLVVLDPATGARRTLLAGDRR